MINTLVPEAERGKYTVVRTPAQTAEIPEGHTFDLLFTSPPFFNFEIYTQAEGQSVQEYTASTINLLFVFFSPSRSCSRALMESSLMESERLIGVLSGRQPAALCFC